MSGPAREADNACLAPSSGCRWTIKSAWGGFPLLLVLWGAAWGFAQPGRDLPSSNSLAGQFLVASQQLADSNFAQTVIYLIAHSGEGAMGVVVNRRVGAVSFRKLLSPLGIKTKSDRMIDVYQGGPVEIGRGLILHSPEYAGASTQQMSQGVALSTGRDVLQAMAAGRGPAKSRFLLGYAGWGAGQLEHEIARGDWLVGPADPVIIFSNEPDKAWSKALLHAGMNL